MNKVSFFSFVEEISKKAIFEAGQLAKDYKKKISVRYKSKNQPVTNADIAIDNFLKSFFKDQTPSIGWVSEETKDNKSRFSSDLFWCLDPIDGTRSYINGKPEYTISLALIKRNKPIIGYILNPETEEFFFAKENCGAFCNNKKILVNENQNISSLKYGISSSEIKKLEKYDFLENQNILRMGSIAYKIALVAKGKIDVAISFTKKNDWDLAASDLILKEAGGKINKISGEDIIYNSSHMTIDSVIASNIKLMQKLNTKFYKLENG
ncbi:MAG: 3'(2'),5'-bisphosphate nucleotidase CysQ [Pseudomonadota bacterium]|nr:3'(2'),5'-bisphosphate nucleotidase CysQ [Pseudomonadota bacterium]